MTGLVHDPAGGHVDSQPPVTGRIAGIDLARSIAILGMFAAHVGPDPQVGGVVGAMMYASHGRASILFATLAGLSLALATGGAHTAGQAVPAVLRRRTVVRAGIIFAFGAGLTMWGTAIPVILAYYGVLFVIALPFLRLRPTTNFAIAAVLALLTPMASIVFRQPAVIASFTAAERFDPLARLGGDSLTNLILTGGYPVLTWTPFIIAGIALGRLELRRPAARLALAVGGAGAAVLAYSTAWIATGIVHGPVVVPMDESNPTTGSPGGLRWSSLFNAEEHTGTPFEIVGGIGTAIVVIALCTSIAIRIPRLVAPLVAMGSMSLTVYVVHLIAIEAMGMAAHDRDNRAALPGESVLNLSVFAAVAVGAAWVWNRYCDRGPLEECIHRATRLVRSSGEPS
ncbi:acyltransferase family protein [Mycobacterium vicinigordonae]|uniref:DUF1624 domain-containing protein n=1 Tax=Mycobacterium vicinigordonae TaxID=1719132 RepID=A0A7D6E3R2_9MYCO|nr:acyltransferase family protein [Mycobacterium vicinigordonae]QLL08246.1 DUF1624 domain-containing protein [Mycobacterium vicinigordonae]